MDISPDELLARYILNKKYIRNDQTLRADAFIPYPWPALSVTRHFKLTDTKIWYIGLHIAKKQKKQLLGRSDLRAADYISQNLKVVSAPALHNCNHANVMGWPAEKPNQKIIALVLAEKAGKIILWKENL